MDIGGYGCIFDGYLADMAVCLADIGGYGCMFGGYWRIWMYI